MDFRSAIRKEIMRRLASQKETTCKSEKTPVASRKSMSQGGKTQLASRKETIPQVGKKPSRVGLAGQFLSARAPMCVIVDRGVLQGTPKCVAFTMAPSVASQYVCNARENDSAQVVDGKW